MDYLSYFIVTIAILVFVHELGHFLAAKICRMRTNVFAIGFGKRLFGWNKINGFTFGDVPEDLDLDKYTDYRLSLLPLGGYVKIAGMIDESFDTEFAKSKPEPYEFRSKPTIQKLFVITAGVMMNLTLTLAVFSGINYFQGKQIHKTTLVGEVKVGTPAFEAGFMTDDKILTIDGAEVESWEEVLNNLLVENLGRDKNVQVERNGEVIDLDIPSAYFEDPANQQFYVPVGYTKPIITQVFPDSPAEKSGIMDMDIPIRLNGVDLKNSADVIEIISGNKNTELPLTLLRGEDTLIVTVKPSIEGKIGIGLADFYAGPKDFKVFSFFESVKYGAIDIVQFTGLTFSMMKNVASGDIEFGSAFGGPVKIAQFAAQSADLGIVPFLRFLAMLSLSLAILNILPFPVLDGGHFVIILVEGIIRRELPLKFKIAIQNAGFIILLLLMAFIIYNDIISL